LAKNDLTPLKLVYPHTDRGKPVEAVYKGRAHGGTRECDPSRKPHAGHPELGTASIEYETPPELFDVLNREFGFTVDVCATSANAKCKRFFTVRENGLAQRWAESGSAVTCWMNPPYGDQAITRWMAKAHGEALAGATVVCLVPARTHTAWFHTVCGQAEVRFLRGRLRYVGTDGEAPFAQLVVILRPSLDGKTLGRPWVMKPWEWRPLSKQRLLDLASLPVASGQ
jgi:site-specific DNA-methyltransferase (adenine-specific)